MGLDDSAEKTRYAWQQLEEAEFNSEQYLAAYDHIWHETFQQDYPNWVKLQELDTERYKVHAGLGDESDEETPDSDPE